ncbi:TetR/AcrR family transcriptional regulator [Archangium lansingense]|uniref:TetR/AcrR family transcriptional regulator n=1 Tax=Archangium lansingense TaxID=2995310 RepID=A0ABT4A959_9BACT|nr:TetR/AcrR family transcriptional regulator [Archangium lansinium]MCY1078131.1 TetR/AcrR family transcriptional regulator [Archangium lansinium]
MQAPPVTGETSPESTENPNRIRLLEGMAAAITEKGYAATTIADVVRHARVSKRTFYEHFEDKDACFLASYVRASEETLRAIATAAFAAGLPWEERIHAAVRTYLHVLEEKPALTRTYLLEILAAGPRALKLRREVHQRFAEQLRELAQTARGEHSELRELSPAMATALVGGINELVLVAVEKGRAGQLRELAETATELVRAVLVAPEK